MKDITGIRSGLLVAIRPTEKKGSNYGVIWECKCDCGNTCYKLGFNLVAKRVKSCGCLRCLDLTGRVFGKLTVLKYSGQKDKNRRRLWECKCECGNVILVATTDITKQRKKSCGCDKADIIGKRFGMLTVEKKSGNDNHGRPSWDQYYLAMAELVSTRSLDPDTQHGCIIVDSNNHVLSIGYNGPISGIDDTQVPLNRPDKYYWMSHAEQNAIIFCNGNMQNSTVYLTGRPCSICVRMLIQKGISRIIHGGRVSSCIDEKDLEHSNLMIALSGVTLEEVDGGN